MREGRLPVDPRTRQQTVDLYDSELAYTDRQVERVLEAVLRTGLDSRTWVIVTSDHGEELWDHGDLGHGRSHYQELLHVPLIISGPGLTARDVDRPVSLMDIAPTLPDLAGLSKPPGMIGQSLTPFLLEALPAPAQAGSEQAGRPIFSQGTISEICRYTVLDGPWKLSADLADGSSLLYRLDHDPLEQEDLAEQEQQVADRLLSLIVERCHTDRALVRGHDATPRIDPTLAAEPESLGYLLETPDLEHESSEIRCAWAEDTWPRE